MNIKSMIKFATSVAIVAAMAIVLLPQLSGGSARLAAQKGGGRGGMSPSMGGATKGRLDAMDAAFTLTKDQKTHIKTLMDEASKSAEPIRVALTKTHADIAAAIQANKGQADIDAATKAYAQQSAAMAALEMKTLAAIMKELTDEQKAKTAAVSQTFFALRSAFLSKNWNDIPDGKNY